MQTKISGKQVAPLTLDNSHFSLGAALATSKLADGLLFSKSDGTVAYTQPIAGVTPVSAADLTTKAYVDALVSGLDPKGSVRVATTANLAALSGLIAIDGITLVAGDRVLVKNQTTASANGIYVAGTGTWVRSSDADVNAEVTAGLHTFVEEGTVNTATGWVLSTTGVIVVNTTALNFVQFSAAGTIQAGNGLTKTGNVLNVASANAGLVSTAGSLALTLADSTLTIAAGGLKLAALTSAQFLVGNASNVATGVAMSGDATLTNTGALSLGAGVVTVAKLAANVVDETKTKRQVSGTILVGQGVGTDVIAKPISGDATMDLNGVFTVSSNLVRLADFITSETPSGLMNDANTTFTLANTPRGALHVYFNGQLMEIGAGNDYTLTGVTISMLFAPSATDKIRASYIK